ALPYCPRLLPPAVSSDLSSHWLLQAALPESRLPLEPYTRAVSHEYISSVLLMLPPPLLPPHIQLVPCPHFHPASLLPRFALSIAFNSRLARSRPTRSDSPSPSPAHPAAPGTRWFHHSYTSLHHLFDRASLLRPRSANWAQISPPLVPLASHTLAPAPYPLHT